MNALNQFVINQLEFFKQNRRDFPIIELINAYHSVGKYFVSSELLYYLDDFRSFISNNSNNLEGWYLDLLNNLLDKFDSKYDYRSYLGLDLLKLPDINGHYVKCESKELDRRIVVLGYDIMRFEILAFEGVENWLPKMPAKEDLLQNRCKKILKAIMSKLHRLNITDQWSKDEIIIHAKKICHVIYEQLTDNEKFTLLISNIPVHTIHDEYLFIRVLQSFETIFTWVVNEQKHALLNFKDNISVTINSINLCCHYFSEAYSLFNLLSTLRPEAFNEFRAYTEGASAIQSRGYKKIEALCRKPDAERLNSISYLSVPEVRNLVLEDYFSLEDMYICVINSNEYSNVNKEQLTESLKHLQSLIHRWKTMHYGLAVRMLGIDSKQGTGYTAGVPYLQEAITIPVFKSF